MQEKASYVYYFFEKKLLRKKNLKPLLIRDLSVVSEKVYFIQKLLTYILLEKSDLILKYVSPKPNKNAILHSINSSFYGLIHRP